MTCESHSTLYIGVTSDPVKRLFQHQNGYFEGFTKKYHLHKLIYYECHETMDSAISREKQLKHWKRAWKEGLINEMNPEWKDLSIDIDW
ncbi:GIY-YIG nuclease family protein [Candidatus Gracilibacteria bacterium]|nr:GIY-YIG nuclease family protein [Candidatus Gracilibacteria bacterium]